MQVATFFFKFQIYFSSLKKFPLTEKEQFIVYIFPVKYGLINYFRTYFYLPSDNLSVKKKY